MLERAKENGIPDMLRRKMRQIVEEYIEVFRVGFDRRPPEKIPPLRIKFTNEVTPIKVKPRN